MTNEKKLYTNISINFLQKLMLIIILPTFFYFLLSKSTFFLGTDINSWIDDWLKFVNCITNDNHSCTELSKFTSAYLINSFVINKLNTLGINYKTSILILNSVILTIPVIFIADIAKKEFSIKASSSYIAAVLFSAVPSFYVRSGALEIQAAIFAGIFYSAILLIIKDELKQPSICAVIIINLSALLFPLYKDTNLALTVLLVSLLFILPETRVRYDKILNSNKSLIISIVISLLFSFVIIIFYNYFRYQSILPIAYIAESKYTSPEITKSFEFFIASVLSPNGGIIAFWSLPFFITSVILVYFKMHVPHIAIFAIIVYIFASLIGFSLWWAPFGWDSWGNRLMLPAMLAAIIIIITLSSVCTKQHGKTLNGKKVLSKPIYIFAVVFALYSLYYTVVSYVSDKELLIYNSLHRSQKCIDMRNVLKQHGPNLGLKFWKSEHYYECADERFLHIPRYTRK